MFMKGVFVCVLLNVSIQISAVIENDLIRHVLQKSYRQCVVECERREQCLSAKFLRRFSLCRLYKTLVADASDSGVTVFPKVGTSACVSPANVCVIDSPESCGQPEDIPGSEILGNIPTVGSVIKYRCLYKSGSATSECLEDGTWSFVDLQCTCGEVIDYNGIPVENVEFWSVSVKDEYHVTAVATCKHGYLLQDQKQFKAVCDVRTGEWTGVGEICCRKLVQDKWLNIYSIPSSNTTGNIYRIFLYGDKHNPSYCYYRNSDILNHWRHNDIETVKIEVVRNGQIAAWATFNGQSTTKVSWMSTLAYNTSSWSTELGQQVPDNFIMDFDPASTLRFFIGEKKLVNGFYPRGWLAVTSFDLNTGSLLEKTHIIYSTDGSVIDMTANQTSASLGLADRLEIWVKLR